MKLSLKQAWMALILFAVMVPVITVMIWYGLHLYNKQLSSALVIERLTNELLRNQIEAEVERLKTLLRNKSDPLTLLINQSENPNNLKDINTLISIIVTRERAIHEVMVLSRQGNVIAAVDPAIGVMGSRLLSVDELQAVALHWGFDSKQAFPEIVIPLMGREYVGSPKKHEGFQGFSVAIPIGRPANAILLALIDVDKLWLAGLGKQGIQEEKASNYLLDQRGSLITEISKTEYKSGDLMTHLAIVRAALIDGEWSTGTPYIGVSNQLVFGTKTYIPMLHWTLISEVIVSRVTQPIWESLVISSSFALFVMVVFVVLVLFLAKRTVLPIQQISEAIAHVARGDYQLVQKSCGIAELDLMSAGFNKMVVIRQQAEEKLQFAARIFNETHEGITLTDARGIIIDVNPGFSNITGYSRDEVIGKTPGILNSGKQSKVFYKEMWEVLAEKGYWHGELWNRNKKGEIYAQLMTITTLLDDEKSIVNYVGLFSDITLAKQQQQSLEQMAHYDMLTGLPNRTLFVDRFSQAIAHSKRNESLLAVCFIDLDEFKPVNDTYGHDVGDRVLIEVAQRIKECIREQDTVSRLGGDEFSLLLGDVLTIEQAEQAMVRIHQAIAKPYKIDEKFVIIAASSGVTIYPIDNADPDTLIRHADSAMYQAKLAGRNRYQIFDATHEQQIIKQHSQLKEIEVAFFRNEFCLYYQPKVNMLTGDVYGVEALIRWVHPDKGLISPLDFLPYFEATDLELCVGNWVIDEALKQLVIWQAEGQNLEVSVNISAFHLQSEGFTSQVDEALAKYPSIPSRLLQLEILESSVLTDVIKIRGIIKNCQDLLGVSIALDDFGTGYSSLTHLRRIPVNIIKIDQSFIRDMLDDPDDYAIVEGVIGLAKAFRCKVVAEGVETRAHGLELMKLGCMHAQGYGIAEPMSAKDVAVWLNEYKPYIKWTEFNNDNGVGG